MEGRSTQDQKRTEQSVAGTPVAGADGVFTVPSLLRTEKGCIVLDHANPDVIMDQADAYISALTQGVRYRLAGERLEILDGEGVVRLVFVREAPLPGEPVDLRGTSWRLITDDDVENDERMTTMIFDGRQVTGSTACRDYHASYEVSEGSVRFPEVRACGDPLRLVRNRTAGDQVNSRISCRGPGNTRSVTSKGAAGSESEAPGERR